MKKFEEFSNIIEEVDYKDHYSIFDAINDILLEKLRSIEVGNESTSISYYTNKDDDVIKKRNDYKNDNGEFTHIAFSIRMFIGNSGFVEAFNSFSEIGEHLKMIDDTIKDMFNVESIHGKGEWFIFLIKIDDKAKNIIKSNNTIKKYKL